jgi:archaellum biogenesis ATPase FlaH
MKSRAELQEIPEAVRRLTEGANSNGPAPPVVGLIGEYRNNTLTSLAGTMRRRNFDEDAISAALIVTNQTRCSPPLDESEVVRIARSVARYEPEAGETTTPPLIGGSGDALLSSCLRRLDMKALIETEPEPINWLFEGVAATEAFTILGGREKRGKSIIMLALSVTAANGGGFIGGVYVKPAKVLYVDAENGKNVIHRRIKLLGLRSENTDNLHYFEARGFDLRSHLSRIQDLIERERFDVVVLDSYRSLWTGDENDDKENVFVLDPLRQLAHDLKVAIVLTHHAQKAGEEYRGSTAIGACVDWCAMLERVHGDDEKGRRRLTVPLARIEAEPDPRWLRIEGNGGDLLTISVAEPFDGTSAEDLLLTITRHLMANNSGNVWMSTDTAAAWCGQANVCKADTLKKKFSDLKKRTIIDTRTAADLVKEGVLSPGQHDGRGTWWRFDEAWWRAQ